MFVRSLSSFLLAVAVGLSFAAPAQAGCGCDHPPPAWALVMPPFASPGTEIRLSSDGFSFQVGATYEVDFDGSAKRNVVATSEGHVTAVMPGGLDSGPKTLKVKGPGVDYAYSRSLFTALAPAPQVPADDGAYVYLDFQGAVSEDGTLLIPLDLSQVADATQFSLTLQGYPIDFSADDVVFYNADGVDLTLFTLAVDDPTERQWGSYYGWSVEEDTGLFGDVYENKTSNGSSFFGLSDFLHYWRHEFHTYNDAHAPGQSHEVGPDGYHLGDGTLHIDHHRLVLAIRGTYKGKPLDPGKEFFNVISVSERSDGPIEPSDMYGSALHALFTGSLKIMTTAGGGDDDDDAYDD